jgi:hypothetical protein
MGEPYQVSAHSSPDAFKISFQNSILGPIQVEHHPPSQLRDPDDMEEETD